MLLSPLKAINTGKDADLTMKAIGLDIGTTTICALVCDTKTGRVIKTITLKNDTFIKTAYPFEKVQDPNLILDKASSIISSLTEEFDDIISIGVTGQMHGIVYLNTNGDAVSNLFTWQDESGNQVYKGKTYSAYISDLTGYKVASGFGSATFFYHWVNKIVPKDAVTFCTIHDYVALKLAGIKVPIVHVSNAASFGLFDINSLSFDEKAIDLLKIPFSFFPRVSKDEAVLGYYNDRIPVSIAIGDNQASFIGSVCDLESCILVNVGTGSQISFVSNDKVSDNLELRPCANNKFISVGSSLCGGRAFAALEKFFRDTAEMVTGEKYSSAYPEIDKMLSGLDEIKTDLRVSTKLSGTRKNPDERGFIHNIGLDNLTPQDFTIGFLNGIAYELYDMYNSVGKNVKMGLTKLVGSGNGLRQNKALIKIFENMFDMKLLIPTHKEEAAFGAFLFSLVANKTYGTISSAQKLIKYE